MLYRCKELQFGVPEYTQIHSKQALGVPFVVTLPILNFQLYIKYHIYRWKEPEVWTT